MTLPESTGPLKHPEGIEMGLGFATINIWESSCKDLFKARRSYIRNGIIPVQ